MDDRDKARLFENVFAPKKVPFLLLTALSFAAGCAREAFGDGGDGGAVQGDVGGGQQASAPGELVAEPEDESAVFWNQTEVVTFEIEISQENLARLDADPTAEQYEEAIFKYGDEVYPGVGLRYKGSYGGWVACFGGSFGTAGGILPGGEKTCPKLSMKVSFDWLDPRQDFHGVDKLNLASLNEDASHMRERLGYALFREFGLAAPRSAYVRLEVNGQFQGLFLAIEEVDKRFARSRFTEGGEGNIYKEIWPDEIDPLVYEPSLRANRRDPNRVIERVVRFAQALGEAPDDAAVAELSDQWLDNDYIMRFIAADRTLAFDDGIFHWYCSGGYRSGNNPDPCSNHNYFWYEETGWDRLWLIAWDMPLSMQGESGFTRIVDEWNDTGASCEKKTNGYPLSPPQLAPCCDKLTHGWASLGAEYASAVRAFLDGPFTREKVETKLDAWSEQIAPVVREAAAAGQGPAAGIWSLAGSDLRRALDELRTAAEARAD
jgi:hypothetical protein